MRDWNDIVKACGPYLSRPQVDVIAAINGLDPAMYPAEQMRLGAPRLFPGPRAAFSELANEFRLSPWSAKNLCVTVVTEHSAVNSSLSRICDQYRVPRPVTPFRMRIPSRARARLSRAVVDGKAAVVIYLGTRMPVLDLEPGVVHKCVFLTPAKSGTGLAGVDPSRLQTSLIKALSKMIKVRELTFNSKTEAMIRTRIQDISREWGRITLASDEAILKERVSDTETRP